MSITGSFAVSIFLLGAAVGTLLTRLQWRAFTRKVSQEMMEQFRARRTGEDGPTRFHHPRAATVTSLSVNDSQHVLSASPVGRYISSPKVADTGLEKMLEQHQMEIAGMLREIQASWDAIGVLDNDPEPSKVFAGILHRTDRISKSNSHLIHSNSLKPH